MGCQVTHGVTLVTSGHTEILYNVVELSICNSLDGRRPSNLDAALVTWCASYHTDDVVVQQAPVDSARDDFEMMIMLFAAVLVRV
jgi:hypothetical protein